jgi:ketosteroid isomerase-like protein
MYKAALRWMVRRNIAALGRGEIEPLLATYAPGAVLRFPGHSSWGGEHRGLRAIEAFLRRFVEVGLVGEPHEILVNGPPWRMIICVLFTDRATDTHGHLVYENRAVLFARVVWGKITYQEDFEDTVKASEFDDYLADSGR